MQEHSHSPELIRSLEETAKELRIGALKMIFQRGQGHPGGAFSAAEIVAALYFHHLNIDPARPDWEDRDRFILSKGHASAILYPALAKKGYFSEAAIETWGHIGSILQGHPDHHRTPGVDMSAGCLGHGISIATGMCLAAKNKGQQFHTYVMIGDGECQAGVLWEGIMLAAKHKLSKLITIMDYNRVQLDGTIDEIMPLEPVKEKWASFNWKILEIDGHNVEEILDALDEAVKVEDKPVVIIANTVKGKGVSFMEAKAEWHAKVPSDEEFRKALEELNV